ncbi:non-homologous end joining protein Ku [Blastomonas aquatica]|uniref:Non-homologous end joining protein Ku n=1 Tax=Blastomonas aquatica TaxID=1510276 RepID=A0ABQ1JQ56_9SPHN|nr:Ku protein [Blastomonas aquatica]GGB74716.1 non-homologous end joining protein Ku [Blastomonas aquatica]
MAARAYWKGHIRLALVSIPVEIYAATKSGAAISFRQIHEPSGKPVKYEKIVPGIGAIDHDDIIKGFELSKGNYVLLDDEEIEAVKLESKRTLELVQFVSNDAIDLLYYTKPYYVVPADDLAEEAYIVLREALKRTKKVGLGQLSLRGQEQLVALRPCGRGLILEVLRYADEVNKAADYFRDVASSKPDADLLDLAETLIDKKSGEFDASDYENHYVDALKRVIAKKAKAKGKRVLEDVDEPAAAGGSSNVIDLMAALKASVGGKKTVVKKTPEEEESVPAKKAPSKKSPTRKRA